MDSGCMVRICAGAKFHDSAVTTYGIQLRAWVDMQVPSPEPEVKLFCSG